jgi:hypothetical protein
MVPADTHDFSLGARQALDGPGCDFVHMVIERLEALEAHNEALTAEVAELRYVAARGRANVLPTPLHKRWADFFDNLRWSWEYDGEEFAVLLPFDRGRMVAKVIPEWTELLQEAILGVAGVGEGDLLLGSHPFWPSEDDTYLENDVERRLPVLGRLHGTVFLRVVESEVTDDMIGYWVQDGWHFNEGRREGGICKPDGWNNQDEWELPVEATRIAWERARTGDVSMFTGLRSYDFV